MNLVSIQVTIFKEVGDILCHSLWHTSHHIKEVGDILCHLLWHTSHHIKEVSDILCHWTEKANLDFDTSFLKIHWKFTE